MQRGSKRNLAPRVPCHDIAGAGFLAWTRFRLCKIRAHGRIDGVPFLRQAIDRPLRSWMPAGNPIGYGGSISAVTE